MKPGSKYCFQHLNTFFVTKNKLNVNTQIKIYQSIGVINAITEFQEEVKHL